MKAEKKILVALSGGVDSGVAALVLKRQGYAVSGIFMKTWVDEAHSDPFGTCPWQEDLDSARSVAETLGIPFSVINMVNHYRERVVSYLVDGYKNGITPNPDLMCNREIKFGLLMQHAKQNGFDLLATGHYCRKVENEDGSYDILQGIDQNKDQSYFLCLLSQEQIASACFPIGHLTKPEVRKLAEEANLPNAHRKDSQDICFLGGRVTINDFLKNYIPQQEGDIVNVEGTVLGKHEGLHNYTLGQRKGIGIPSNADFKKYVVVGKIFEKNQLIVAFEDLHAPGLYTNEVLVRDLQFINKPLTIETELQAKPRYRDPCQDILFAPLGNNQAKITFRQQQRALAKGQAIAFYQNQKLIGGAIYC
ncbi:MAG: tRNA 2-thiouridine(34) synthase MnmA [Verrucomicrobia bacterium GWC2_42_7]|nr:MAG: tRNA 2-thiouridine(34) synthase MnmA [Verrucomicrobia bacterium GWC2_42_7]